MVGKELKTIEIMPETGGVVAPLQFEPSPLPLYLEIVPKEQGEARKSKAENIEIAQSVPDFEPQKGATYIQNNITNNTTNNYYTANNTTNIGHVSGVIAKGVLVLAEFLAALAVAIIVGAFKGVVSGIVLVLTRKTEPHNNTNNNTNEEIEIDNGSNITYYPTNNNNRPTYFVNIGEGVQINKNHE